MRILLVVLTLFLAAPGWADEDLRADGHLWQETTKTEKIAYISGILTGIGLAGDCIKAKISEVATISQYADGLDQFYSDFKNKHIPIAQAFSVVNAQLNGASKSLIEEYITLLRKRAVLLETLTLPLELEEITPDNPQ
ncbi:hypothetical protein [Nitrospina watsonii]|uniref:Uncharacterized protein n=1 Tax=Nitrospina watsonii TaxID=1323948 RepID=A0ABM9HF47_9BACT|nr:hypothetical protein [Nitrospina watsonii]CAI2718690.1 conserved exported protein of unknown function [Nitrospina watsonii]